jgi:hypothetical protein
MVVHMAHTYVCRSCVFERPCVCPDATDVPTECPIRSVCGNPVEWEVADDIIISVEIVKKVV